MNTLKIGIKMSIKMIFVMILSFFLYFSINVIVSAIASDNGRTAWLIIGQIFALTLVSAFISSPLYAQGMTDKNLVKIGHIKRDIWKGFRIGLIGNLPFFLLLIVFSVMVITRNDSFRTAWYTLLNSHYFAFCTWIAGNAEVASELHIWKLIPYFALQFIVPIISAASYVLGYQDKIHLGKLAHDTVRNMLYKKEDK